MRALRCLVAVGAAAAISSCGSDTDDRLSGAPSPTSSGRAAQSTAADTVAVGDTVEFLMHTHCGVESARINGRVWNAVEPLYDSPKRLGPPAGWGNPEQLGRLTLTSQERAVFSALGQRVVLVPSQTGEPLRACD